jgi:hypothetical protein
VNVLFLQQIFKIIITHFNLVVHTVQVLIYANINICARSGVANCFTGSPYTGGLLITIDHKKTDACCLCGGWLLLLKN